VVPTYRRPDLLRRCLDALAAQDLPAECFEVAVVDDGSGDETPEVLTAAAERMINLRWASQPRNAGPAAARNRAVGLGSAPLLLFIDDDIVVPASLVRTHLQLNSDQGDKQGVVGRVEWHPDLPVTPFMAWLDETDLQFAFHRMDPGPVPSPEQAFYTCNLSLHRRLFETAGGFDERFPYPAYEDVELGWRLGRLGFELHYRPEALAWHARQVTLPTFCARTAMVMESAVLLRRTHPEVPVAIAPPSQGVKRQLLRAALRPLSALRPTIAGRDVRSRYYWTEIEHARVIGLRRAGFMRRR